MLFIIIFKKRNRSTAYRLLWDCKRLLASRHLHDFINHCRCGNLIELPPFHGCNRVNKNGTRKLIMYEMGEQCVVPTWKRYWRKPKPKYRRKIGFLYFIGQGIWPKPGTDIYLKTKVTLFIILSLRSMNIWVKLQCDIILRKYKTYKKWFMETCT